MPNRRDRRALACCLTLSMAAVAAGCTSDGTPAADPATYRAELAAICVASNAERAALTPPDDASVATFADAVADILTRQADDARALQAPDDLDADHRAFVQNTADQAAQWAALASTPTDDTEQFGTIQTAVLELTLGRDDLATAMNVPECRVQAE